ncbi:hypothetical protein DFH09DRAFT_1108613 [Mycena vulgaris]|nr:hypothetical protein DFH09DRAFT_1108613 [Mycena vulgaris]
MKTNGRGPAPASAHSDEIGTAEGRRKDCGGRAQGRRIVRVERLERRTSRGETKERKRGWGPVGLRVVRAAASRVRRETRSAGPAVMRGMHASASRVGGWREDSMRQPPADLLECTDGEVVQKNDRVGLVGGRRKVKPMSRRIALLDWGVASSMGKWSLISKSPGSAGRVAFELLRREWSKSPPGVPWNSREIWVIISAASTCQATKQALFIQTPKGQMS